MLCLPGAPARSRTSRVLRSTGRPSHPVLRRASGAHGQWAQDLTTRLDGVRCRLGARGIQAAPAHHGDHQDPSVSRTGSRTPLEPAHRAVADAARPVRMWHVSRLAGASVVHGTRTSPLSRPTRNPRERRLALLPLPSVGCFANAALGRQGYATYVGDLTGSGRPHGAARRVPSTVGARAAPTCAQLSSSTDFAGGAMAYLRVSQWLVAERGDSASLQCGEGWCAAAEDVRGGIRRRLRCAA
jgi:hypothetical protein